MRKIYLLLATALLAFSPHKVFDSTPTSLPFTQDWTNATLITTNDIWTGVPGIQGFLGQDMTTATGTDPQTLLGVSALGGDLTVLANQSSPTISNGDVAEFDGIPNPTIALQGSGTADAPHIIIYLNTTGLQNVNVAYNLRDLDATTDNAVQPVALQYRIGNSGNFTNIPAGFVADATTGPSLATLVTPVSTALPPACNNQAEVQVRIMTTNAVGNDEWVGIDDINITGSPISSNSANSDIIANGSFVASSNINALLYQGADISVVNSLEVAQFTVRDGGGAADADALSTILTNLNMGLTNSIDINRVALYDGTTELAEVAGGSTVSFSGLTLTAPDNGSKTFSVRVTFHSTVTDNHQFVFNITSATADAAGSSFAAANAGGAASSNTGDDNRIEVTADRLSFVQHPTNTGTNAAMSPPVTVSANDVLGNRDLDFVSDIRITSTGSLSGSPVINTAIAGLTTFNNLIHTANGTGLTLTAQRNGTLDWDTTSIPFDIQTGSSPTNYFRSAATGDWSSTSTWQSSPDNSTWSAATLVPDQNANTISIRNGHTVTISSAISADQVVIENGGILTNTAGVFTIQDGTGDDITIQNGGVFTLAISGSPVFGTGSPSVNVGSGGILRVSRAGYTGNGTGVNSSNYIYQNASILEYTLASAFSASGVTYFPNVNASTIPIFRTTSSIAGVGGTNPTVINGVYEAEGNITFQSAGSKTFRNGIRGSGTITQDATSGAFIINGATAQLGGFGSLSLNTAGMSIASTSATTLLNNKSINGSTFTIDGSLESALNFFAQISGTTSVTINGTVGIEHLSGLAGMFVNTGGLILGPASTVEFKSTAGAQTLNGRPDYFNVIISGTSSKSVSGNATINGTLTLTNTIVTATPGNLITMTANASVAGGSTASYIDGALIRQTNSTGVYIFPIGRGGSTYKPIGLIPASTDPSSFSAEYFSAGINTTSPACNPSRLQAYVNNEYWDVQRTSGTADAQIRLNYIQAASNGNWTDGTSGVANPDASKAITVAHYTGTCWAEESSGAGILAGDASSGQVTSRPISTFSPITFGYGPFSVLPVNLANVKATQQHNSIKVEWSNMTELDIMNYSIERSADGRNFVSLGAVNAKLNNGARADYDFIDANPLAADNYYRIKSLESSGKIKFSIIVKVDIRNGATVLVLYPNPTIDGQLTYQANNLVKGKYTIRIVNSMGQQVYNKTLNHPGGSVSEVITLPPLKAGLYSLQLRSDENKFVKTFVVP